MMFRTRQAAKFLFISMFALLGLSGCHSGDKHNLPPAPEPSSSPPGDHLTISVAFWDIGKAFAKKDAVLQRIESKFNVTLVPVQISMYDYVQKLQMWATSGNLPDVFTHSIASDTPAVYADWIRQRLVRPLPDDLTPYPNVYRIAQIPDVRLLMRDNRQYMLPRIGYPTNALWMLERVVFVRKDWMTDLRYGDPENFEQFSSMMKAFSIRGKTGLTAASIKHLTWIFNPTFPQFSTDQWVLENEIWIPYYASKKMNGVVSQLRELYQSGGLDEDVLFMKEEDALHKFARGDAGALAYRATPNDLRKMEDLWNKYQPDKRFYDYVKVLHLWPSDDGHRYYYVAPT